MRAPTIPTTSLDCNFRKGPKCFECNFRKGWAAKELRSDMRKHDEESRSSESIDAQTILSEGFLFVVLTLHPASKKSWLFMFVHVASS